MELKTDGFHQNKKRDRSSSSSTWQTTILFTFGPPIGASKPTFSNMWGLESTLTISSLNFKNKHQEKKLHKFNTPVATIADFASTMKKCLTFPTAKSSKKQANWAHKHKISEGEGGSLPFVLSNHVGIKGIFMGVVFTSSFGF
jgi:hypothetical protein